MPASKQSGVLKVVLPLVAFVILFTLVFAGAFLGGGKQNQNQPLAQTDSETEQASEDATEPAEVQDDAGSDEVAEQPDAGVEEDDATDTVNATPEPEAPAIDPTPTDIAGLPDTWHVRSATPGDWASLGSRDPSSGYELELSFDPAGAGLSGAVFANHYKTAAHSQEVRHGATPAPEWHYAIEETRGDENASATMKMVGARAVYITDHETGSTGQFDLRFTDGWREVSPGSFELEIVDQTGGTVVVLSRTFDLAQGSYDIGVEQTLENRSGRALDVVWFQYGPSDLPPETSGYRIESRRVRLGYTRANEPQYVQADGKLRGLPKVVQAAEKNPSGREVMWPDDAHSNAGELVWIAQTNRHFMFAMHPLISESDARANLNDPNTNPLDKALRLGSGAVRADAVIAGDLPYKNAKPPQKHLDLEMATTPLTVNAGESLDLSFGLYLGPLSDRFLKAETDPVYGVLHLKDAVVYQIGFCGVCTFQWIARPLLGLLRFFHGYVVFDWGIAIILLVCCVRAVLHPITKKSQVSMMRFSKQMQRLGPKQQKIKERYKDDRQRMNQEMAKLMREEGVNPLGMLGCLPMFLQTPIWIALYATIYFVFDLRHVPAFFGLFQQFGGWSFLNDLSSPDHFIDFGGPLFTVPLMGSVSGLNILPLLMGAIFFVQQKYMSPPPSGNMSSEQESTQKIMKVMLVVMMPVFMYNAPAGLTMYILTSSSIGVLESRYIRAHVDKLDLESPPKKPQPKGRKKVQNTAQTRGPEERQHYKNRPKG